MIKRIKNIFKKKEVITPDQVIEENIPAEDPLYYATTRLLPHASSYYTSYDPNSYPYPPPAVAYPVPAKTVLPPLPIKKITYSTF